MLKLSFKSDFSCKLYHNPTWFETSSASNDIIRFNNVANYTTIQLGLKPPSKPSPLVEALSCKLYHNPTWFETGRHSLTLEKS